MIKVSGVARFDINFNIKLDMTEEEWDSLSYKEQDKIIDEMIGVGETESAEITDIDVFDLIEIGEGEENK